MNSDILRRQILLQSYGFNPGPLDGIDGPKTRAALVAYFSTKPRVLKGDGSWGWEVEIVGDDLVIRAARATCFGGSNDPQDSGATASGISTKQNPNLQAVSLPMDGRFFPGMSKAEHAALDGSPIPRLPWKTLVRVTNDDHHSGIFPVIDLGPGKRTGNKVDLTVAAARTYDSGATATRFEMKNCTVTIIGGAKYAIP
ncbi:MAG: peptidoglycan-binding domain-containing protein [Luteolibacter sp.]